MLSSGRADILETSEKLEDAKEHLKALEDTRRRKFAVLGVSDTAQLNKLKNNAFLQSRMNALALKQRLRDKLRQCKFELEKLERSYRCTINGDF